MVYFSLILTLNALFLGLFVAFKICEKIDKSREELIKRLQEK